MTLHQLRVFLKVAELGSFTEAGRAIHTVQPSVSNLVKELSRELGAKLFERVSNKPHLTSAGEELRRRAQEIAAKVDQIKPAIEEITGAKRGRISVGGAALPAASFLPVAIQNFKKQHPGVDVTLTIEKSDTLEKKLLDGELDLAIIGRAHGSPRLYSEPYREEEVVVIASPKHPLTKRRSVTLEEAAKEPWISYVKGTVRDMLEKIFADRGLQFKPMLEVDIELGGRDTIKCTVMNGICIGYLHKYHVLQDVKDGRLKILRIPDLNLKRTLHIVIRKTRANDSLVQAFVKFLRHYKQSS